MIRGGAATALVAVMLVLAAAGCSDRADPPDGRAELATVEWVLDGDSLRLTDGRVVRLVQIDAPEARTDCFGREATRALVRQVRRGTQVTLERDAALDDLDAYDRLLRYVLVEGRNVNLSLVAEGAAVPYFFRNDRGRYAGELLTAARAARADGVGLWGVCPRARLDPGRGSVTGSATSQTR